MATEHQHEPVQRSKLFGRSLLVFGLLAAVAAVAIFTTINAALPSPSPTSASASAAPRSLELFGVLQAPPTEQDSLLDGVRTDARVEIEVPSTRWLADVNGARVWLARSAKHPTSVCLVIARLRDPEYAAVGCGEQQQIQKRGLFGLAFVSKPDPDISLLLIPDQEASLDADQYGASLSDRAWLVTGRP